MEVRPETLLSLQQPQNLPLEARQQVLQLISSPQVVQFLVEKTVDIMIQNCVAITETASGDFIRGVNRGTLLLLNALVEHIEEDSNVII